MQEDPLGYFCYCSRSLSLQISLGRKKKAAQADCCFSLRGRYVKSSSQHCCFCSHLSFSTVVVKLLPEITRQSECSILLSQQTLIISLNHIQALFFIHNLFSNIFFGFSWLHAPVLFQQLQRIFFLYMQIDFFLR